MKNTLKITTLLIFCLALTSCKKSVKKEQEQPVVATSIYALDESTAKIGWTAYKTSEKVPVKGEFKQVTFKNEAITVDPIDAINGTTFSIPVSSLFSNNADRDYKLVKLFFGVMENTELLSASISITNENSGNLSLTMNAATQRLPFTYTLIDNVFALSGVMDLEQWNGQAAIASINKACFNLHKGADGISKTWNDVQIDASISIVKK